MKKYLILILSLTAFAAAASQTVSEKYAEAMAAYNNKNYALAYNLFREFNNQSGIQEKELLTASEFYEAESLYNLALYDASSAAYEDFTTKYEWSNFRPLALFRLGNIYFTQRKFAVSRSRLITLINAYPESEYVGSSFYLIGSSYTEENRLQDAENFFKNAIESKRNNKLIDYSIYSLAYVYENMGQYKKAIEYYDRLLNYYPNSPMAPNAQVRIGLCYFIQKDYNNAALELSDPKIDDLPLDQQREAKYVLANSFYKMREFDQAEGIFKNLLKKNPEAGLARQTRYSLAWTYFQQKKYDESYNEFNGLSQSGMDSIAMNSLYWSAEAKRQQGKVDEALKIYSSFIQKYPTSSLNSKAKLQAAALSYDFGKMQVSEDFLFQAVNSTDPQVRGKALILLGEIRLKSKNYLNAKDFFQSALAVPGAEKEITDRAALGLGISNYFLNEYDAAIKNLAGLLSTSPNFEPDKVNFYLAESYFAANQFEKAQTHYRKISKDNEEFRNGALYGEAYSYFNQKDFNKAIYAFQDYLKLGKSEKNYVDAKIRLADSYYGAKRFQDASRIYKEVYLIGSANLNNDYAYYQYAQALYRAGNPDDAVNEFTILQQKFPNSKYCDEAQYIIGWIKFQRGRFGEAIDAYKELEAKYPDSPVLPIATYSIGDAHFNMSQYNEAITAYNKVLTNYPASNYVLDALNGIQYSYIALNRPQDAIKLIDDFVGRNPNLPFVDQILYRKGEIYFNEREFQQAKQSYVQFVSSYPKSKLAPNALYGIAKSAEGLDQKDEAMEYYGRVYREYPNSEFASAAVIELAEAYVDEGNTDGAIALYGEAINKFGQSAKKAEILFARAQLYTEKGDITAAYNDYNTLMTDHEGSIFAENAKLEIGILELARKNYQSAEALFRELSETRTDDVGARAQYYLGMSLYEQEKYDDAISAFVRVTFIFSRFEEWTSRSYMQLGEIYTKREDKLKAREMYKAVLARHKGDEIGEEAAQKMRALD
jgi:TolA-binding protein